MALFTFGEFDEQLGYKTLNERAVRGSSGIMMLVGAIAMVNGFVLRNFDVLPWFLGFMALNFALAVFINPKVAPTYAIAKWLVRKQTKLPIGAIQKRFAWTLGLLMVSAAFGMSFLLINDASWFDPVCMICVLCLLFMFLETAFGICVGCQTYFLAIKLKIIKPPEVKPNCMGDACEIQ